MSNRGRLCNLWVEPTSSRKILESLRIFCVFLESSIGPRGGVKMLVSAGGYLTLTSISGRLMKTLAFTHPIILLIVNFMKSQFSLYDDFGLYTGLLSGHIIEKTLGHNGREMALALQAVSDRCIALLEFTSAKANLDSVNHLLSVVETILRSKPSCGLSDINRTHLSIQIVKGFLGTIGEASDSDGIGWVVLKSHSGPGVEKSEVLDGLLYPLHENESFNIMASEIQGPWRLVLYSTMLTPQPKEEQKAGNIIDISSSLKQFKPLLAHFTSLVPRLLQAEVRLVACQKVIHPEIQWLLRRRGILVLHRLGSELAQALQRLSGASMLDTPVTEEWSHGLGTLGAVSLITRHDKQYIHLQREGGDLATLLLYNLLPDTVEELEAVTRQALSGLSQLIISPKLLPGGGCLESWLACRLREEVLENGHTECAKLGCTYAQLTTALSWVEKALLKFPRLLARSEGFDLLVDSIAHHTWPEQGEKCLCRALSRYQVSEASWTELPLPALTSSPCLAWEPTEGCLVDVYTVKASALSKAFEACQAVLAIDSIIHH